MPNRVVREGFLDSPAVHALGDPAECFFHRLLLAADDAGRFDGRAEILRSRLFPLDTSRRVSDVEKSLALCVKEALVIPYEWDGRPYLQLAKVYRSSPATTSKFPWMDGSFKFSYVKRETRDGEKEFVATSIPSVRHTEGIPMGYDPLCPQPPVYGDVYGDGDGISPEPPPSVPTAILLPLNTGEEHPVTEVEVSEFEGLYPAVDVMQQLRAMRAWLITNPFKRKTKSGVMRFVNSWLSKEQNSGRPATQTPPPRKTRKEL